MRVVIVVLVLFIVVFVALLLIQRAEIKDLKRRLVENAKLIKELQPKDPLTQVIARDHFLPLLEQEFLRAKRSGKWLSIIACDLDCFTKYNQMYGEEAGNQALYAIAQVIDGTVKRAGECVSRFGDDEFWILLPNVSEKKAVQLAELIKRKIHSLDIMYPDSPINIRLTVSQGIVSFRPAAEDRLEEWLPSVSLAVTNAQQNGGNCWHVA